jgi:heme-degrading monooxygenase HmoA
MKNADTYENLLKDEIFVWIQEQKFPGFKGIQLLRREIDGETEFITIMQFDSIDAVRQFAGDDYETAVVPASALALLTRYDERSQHYKVITSRPSIITKKEI